MKKKTRRRADSETRSEKPKRSASVKRMIGRRKKAKQAAEMQTQARGDAQKPKEKRKTLAKASGGRPMKLTPDLAEVIYAGVEKGLSQSAAGRLAGVIPQTVSEWRGRFPWFSEGIETARARGMDARLDAVIGGVLPSGLRDWRASAWLLERLAPEDFGKKATEISVSATANAAAAGSGMVLSEEDIAALQERRARALGVGKEMEKGRLADLEKKP